MEVRTDPLEVWFASPPLLTMMIYRLQPLTAAAFTSEAPTSGRQYHVERESVVYFIVAILSLLLGFETTKYDGKWRTTRITTTTKHMRNNNQPVLVNVCYF
jgi:hypothetical protein